MGYLVILIGYLIGSIPFALIVGKIFFKKDIRTLGSGNLGATNVFRTLGKKAGICVMLLDITKGLGATYLPVIFHQSIHPLVFGIAAIIGHSLSIFIKFKGGKSVATTAGVFLGYQPILFVIGLFVFLICLKTTKYVSLSSMIASISLFIAALFYKDLFLIIVTLLISIFIIYRHRENIIRIKNKNEPKVKWI
jgi:glycerol-3-phosphate acyltransferase PlsY